MDNVRPRRGGADISNNMELPRRFVLPRAQKIKEEISKLDEKLDKLMTAYLEGVLNVREYAGRGNLFPKC